MISSTWYWVIIVILIILIIAGIIGLIYFDNEYRKCLDQNVSLNSQLSKDTQIINSFAMTPIPLSGAGTTIPTIFGQKVFATYDASGSQVLTNVTPMGSTNANVKLQNLNSFTNPITTQQWIVQVFSGGFTIATGDGTLFWALPPNFAENDKVFLSASATTFQLANNKVSSFQVAGNTEFVLTIDSDGDVAIVPSDDMFLPSKLFSLFVFGFSG